MKKYFRILQNSLLSSALLFLILTAISCKSSKENPVITFQASLNGMSEVPPNNSTSTGVATLTYDTIAKKFDIVVTYNGITPTASHIHKGAPGVSGGVVFGFTNPLTSPITYTSPVLTPEQQNDLYTGQYYVNIHSSAFPNGEIRGQLIRKP
jgi:hypothetical protein